MRPEQGGRLIPLPPAEILTFSSDTERNNLLVTYVLYSSQSLHPSHLCLSPRTALCGRLGGDDHFHFTDGETEGHRAERQTVAQWARAGTEVQVPHDSNVLETGRSKR